MFSSRAAEGAVVQSKKLQTLEENESVQVSHCHFGVFNDLFNITTDITCGILVRFNNDYIHNRKIT